MASGLFLLDPHAADGASDLLDRLDDSTRDNGCLNYVPGSHRWPLLPPTGLVGDMDAIRDGVEPRAMASSFNVRWRSNCGAGECSFHHPLMVHGSFENRTDRPRRATVVNVLRDGVKSSSDEPLLAGVPPVPNGRPIDGQFFPLLLDPAKLPE